MIAVGDSVIFSGVNMQIPIARSTLDTPEKKWAAAAKAIALAGKMNWRSAGLASDALIAERRLEFWREEVEFLNRAK